jgi:hypothetical protein
MAPATALSCWNSTGASSRSYLQGVLPTGGSLSSLKASEVLFPDAGAVGTGTGSGTGTATGTGTSTGTSPGAGTGTGSGSGSGTAPLSPGGINSGNSGDRLWGEQFFAPYVDMTLYPVPDLDGLARSLLRRRLERIDESPRLLRLRGRLARLVFESVAHFTPSARQSTDANRESYPFFARKGCHDHA